MKSIAGLVVALLTVFPADAKYSGYAFSCVKIKASQVCPQANSYVQGWNANALQPIYAALEQGLAKIKGNVSQKCYNAMQSFFCLAIPQCVDSRRLLHIDFAKINAQCKKLDTDCAPGVCNSLDSAIKSLERDGMFKCVSLQDPSTYCANVDYKVVQFGEEPASADFQRKRIKLQMALQRNSNLSKNCADTVKTFGCYLARGPFCSDDETYMMSPISKEECEKKMKCLPVSYNAKGEKEFPHSTCDLLPTQNSKRLPNPRGTPDALGGPDPVNHATNVQAATILSIAIAFIAGSFLL